MPANEEASLGKGHLDIRSGGLVHRSSGLNIAGAFHVYALAVLTNDAQYAASFYQTGFPVEYVTRIEYQRGVNDATGVGVSIRVPAERSPFSTLSTGQGYARAPGAFNTVFWHDGKKGKTVLHFFDQLFSQGTAISKIYTQPGSRWDNLFSGGGLGPCTPSSRDRLPLHNGACSQHAIR